MVLCVDWCAPFLLWKSCLATRGGHFSVQIHNLKLGVSVWFPHRLLRTSIIPGICQVPEMLPKWSLFCLLPVSNPLNWSTSLFPSPLPVPSSSLTVSTCQIDFVLCSVRFMLLPLDTAHYLVSFDLWIVAWLSFILWVIFTQMSTSHGSLFGPSLLQWEWYFLVTFPPTVACLLAALAKAEPSRFKEIPCLKNNIEIYQKRCLTYGLHMSTGGHVH